MSLKSNDILNSKTVEQRLVFLDFRRLIFRITTYGKYLYNSLHLTICYYLFEILLTAISSFVNMISCNGSF